MLDDCLFLPCASFLLLSFLSSKSIFFPNVFWCRTDLFVWVLIAGGNCLADEKKTQEKTLECKSWQVIKRQMKWRGRSIFISSLAVQAAQNFFSFFFLNTSARLFTLRCSLQGSSNLQVFKWLTQQHAWLKDLGGIGANPHGQLTPPPPHPPPSPPRVGGPHLFSTANFVQPFSTH